MLPNKLQNSVYGFLNSTILFTCVELDILSYLARKKSPVTLDVLSTYTGINGDKLERLLNAACAIGLIEGQSIGENDKCFGINEEMRAYFLPESHDYLVDFIRHLSSKTYPVARSLTPKLIQGTNEQQPESVMSMFETMYGDEQQVESFLNAMWNLGIKTSPQFAANDLFSQLSTLVDLGGGAGHFAISAVEQHSNLHACVYDLAHVEKCFSSHASRSFATVRLRFIAGNFWQDPLPKADVYALSYILSDWSDKNACVLLTRVRDQLPVNGYLLILEKLFDPSGRSPYPTLMQDIAMLLETEGKHRTLKEFQQLLFKTGFDMVDVQYSLEEKHMIIAKKR